MLAGRQCSDHRLENLDTVRTTQFRFGGAFRMRHHAHHIPARAAYSGNILQGAVGIGVTSDFARWRTIAEHDSVVSL